MIDLIMNQCEVDSLLFYRELAQRGDGSDENLCDRAPCSLLSGHNPGHNPGHDPGHDPGHNLDSPGGTALTERGFGYRRVGDRNRASIHVPCQRGVPPNPDNFRVYNGGRWASGRDLSRQKKILAVPGCTLAL